MRMPALFLGHGSPMNAIEDNAYSKCWRSLGGSFERPEAVIAVSAHWYSDQFKVGVGERNKQIYDMYGFPRALYELRYSPCGSRYYTEKIVKACAGRVIADTGWGIDHGVWSVLTHMYPDCDIPVVMMSVNIAAAAKEQFELGELIRGLREEGALILGSGNVVHNLALLNETIPDGGYEWAEDFDGSIRDAILKRDFTFVIEAARTGRHLGAFETVEHFYPLLTVLGASMPEDKISVLNEGCTLGALSMTSYVFSERKVGEGCAL